MKMQNKMIMLIALFCASDVYAMLHGTIRAKPSRRGKTISAITAKTHFDFRRQIEEVGLNDCRRALQDGNGCQDKWCCSNAYPSSGSADLFQEAQDTKNRFLQMLDQSKIGRLQAALQIKRKYKKLGVIAKEIHNSGLQKEDTKWLQKLISHQKYCLANQFRVIAEASPVVEEKSKYTLGLSKNGDLKIKKTCVLVAINEGDKE